MSKCVRTGSKHVNMDRGRLRNVGTYKDDGCVGEQASAIWSESQPVIQLHWQVQVTLERALNGVTTSRAMALLCFQVG